MPMPKTKAPSGAMCDLLIAEYQARLERYRQLAGHQSQLQNWALVFSGALWGWVLSHSPSEVLVAASWIPFIANIFFFTKTRVLKRIAENIYCRLDQIVCDVGYDDPDYVEKWVAEDWRTWSKWFWRTVLLLTGVMAIGYTVLFCWPT
ncbi:MAG: hypothetical protein JSU95_14210 [Betaproteobacteria bacterium]|nr:MAG: hypothetical protein JSU95_14210 [Betaproteobacteria bacterium]